MSGEPEVIVEARADRLPSRRGERAPRPPSPSGRRRSPPAAEPRARSDRNGSTPSGSTSGSSDPGNAPHAATGSAPAVAARFARPPWRRSAPASDPGPPRSPRPGRTPDQVTQARKPRQLQRVAAIRLDPVPLRTWNQRRCHHRNRIAAAISSRYRPYPAGSAS